MKSLAVTGLLGAVAAVVATTIAAALARAVGVDFEISGGARPSRCPGSPS